MKLFDLEELLKKIDMMPDPRGNARFTSGDEKEIYTKIIKKWPGITASEIAKIINRHPSNVRIALREIPEIEYRQALVKTESGRVKSRIYYLRENTDK